MIRALLAALLAVVMTGCGPERIPPPSTPAPALATPGAAIPADLDVAVRLDLERIRSALGQAALARLREQAAASAGREPELSRMMADLLLASKTIWVALRPNANPAHIDNVVILSGHFADVDPRTYALTPRFGPAIDLGGGWRMYERQGVKERVEPARLYARGDELVVLASTAEIDSMERQLEQRAGDEHVEPADKGVVSFAARAPALARWVEDRSVTVARMLDKGRSVSGFASLEAAGLEAEVELGFEQEEHAQAVGEALGELARSIRGLGSVAESISKGLSVEVVGRSVVLRLRLSSEVLASAIAAEEPK
ncbi:MAG: hypothetical protein KC776_13230 [Myxococcales bacterium]|nr:hypothetical protein [Myxococcales bacterium]MCB9580792.1 hypothetical protein [Polyangiaceae bacterium]